MELFLSSNKPKVGKTRYCRFSWIIVHGLYDSEFQLVFCRYISCTCINALLMASLYLISKHLHFHVQMNAKVGNMRFFQFLYSSWIFGDSRFWLVLD